MIALRMARVAPIYSATRPNRGHHGETGLAFRYLILFRRIVVSLALVGAVVAWTEQWPGLQAACICIAIGEFLESSYYLNVLHWRDGGRSVAPEDGRARHASRRPVEAGLTSSAPSGSA